MATKLERPKIEHDKTTNVMFVDFAVPDKGSGVDVIEGPKGIHLHIEMTTGTVVGVRIVNWNAFYAEAIWKYYAFRTRDIVNRIVTPLVQASEATSTYYHRTGLAS